MDSVTLRFHLVRELRLIPNLGGNRLTNDGNEGGKGFLDVKRGLFIDARVFLIPKAQR
jgi:hypothetical protein